VRLLLGSGGIRTPERKELWTTELVSFLGPARRTLWVPWAVADHEGHTQRMQEWLAGTGVELDGIHRYPDARREVERAQAIFVSGGNTFRLVRALHEHDLLAAVRERVRDGVPYVGVSAGSVVAAPTLATTNDMPICRPPSHETFGLLPFQINPHFVPGVAHYVIGGGIVPYAGETREDRLREYHEMNDPPVLALPEGAILRVEGAVATLLGPPGALLLRRGLPVEPLAPGADLSALLSGSAAGP
jgi:dipeptidase E